MNLFSCLSSYLVVFLTLILFLPKFFTIFACNVLNFLLSDLLIALGTGLKGCQ